MSFFGVTIRKIEKVWHHPAADRLDIAQVNGTTFQFVVGRDQYKGGELVLYFPVDSVLPGWIIAKLGLTGKLSGKEKNRVKTVRLRGEISQGLVAPLDHDFLLKIGEGDWSSKSADATLEGSLVAELTQRLGVTKYEPPVVPCHSGNLVGIPSDIGVYDIEGADQFPDVVETLMDQMVCITEKVEGMNFWVSAAPCEKYKEMTNDKGEHCYNPLGTSVSVGQRNFEIQPINGFEHDFWRIVREQKLDRIAQILATEVYNGKRVTLRGEYCGPGVQGNIYKFPENRIYFFDILVNEQYLPPQEFLEICWSRGLNHVPLIAKDVKLRDWLGSKSIRVASNGESKIAIVKMLREGIVIKPMVEQRHPKIGRLMIKQRDPVYLSETDA